MFRWYVINTYSGHENKVKANLEHRVKSMSKEEQVRRVVVPTESVVETKDGQKVQTERRLWPGYVLVHMDLNASAPTKVALEYVYPKLVPGGAIVFDDYGWNPVSFEQRDVIDEYSAPLPENVIALPSGQALLVKLP